MIAKLHKDAVFFAAVFALFITNQFVHERYLATAVVAALIGFTAGRIGT